jgi:hypothetical protein
MICLQVLPYQFQYPFVRNLSGEHRHENVVVDVVEELFEIDGNAPVVSFAHIFLRFQDCLGAPPRRNPKLESENSGSKIPSSFWWSARRIIRSIAVVMPSYLTPPFGFGISIARTDCGR